MYYTYISIFNDYNMCYSYRCYRYYMYIRSLSFSWLSSALVG